MNKSIQIGLWLLFIVMHLSTGRFFVETQAGFYFAFVLLTALAVIQKRHSLKFGFGLWLMVALLASLVLRFFLQGNPYGSSQFFMLSACVALFFVFSLLFSARRHLATTAAWAVATSVIVEICLGFAQMTGLAVNNDDIFRIGGSMGNPNAYAGYIAVVAPLLLSLWLAYRKDKRFENASYLLAGCLLLAVFMLAVSRSRGAWLAALIGCAIMFNVFYNLLNNIIRLLNTPVRKALATAVVVIFVVAGGFALYHVKAQSAFGRVLIWKVTLQTPHDHLLAGSGINSFAANYGKWQAAYFANGGGTEAERLVADYVTCAYNDFVQTALEQGLPVALILALLLVIALTQRQSRPGALFVGAKASIAAIVVLMFVSYPLNVPSILLYMMFCLAILLGTKAKTVRRLRPIKLVLLLLACGIATLALRQLYGIAQMRQGMMAVLSGRIDNALTAYAKAEPMLAGNETFYYQYGVALTTKGDTAGGAAMYEKAAQNGSSPNTFVLLGRNYQALHRADEARQAYLTAINMIPTKLYPKYCLVQLLRDMLQYEEARYWATEILRTPEKAPTTAAREIKAEMETFLASPTIWQLGKNNFD